MRCWWAVVGLLAAAVAGYALWPGPGCRAPATRAVAGREVTLERVERLPDGKVRAVLLAHPSSVNALRLARIGRATVSGATVVERRWLNRRADGTIQFDLTLRMARGQRSFSLAQELKYEPPGRRVAFRFHNVRAGSLPVRAKCGDLDAVLREVHANKPVASNKNQTPGGYRWIMKSCSNGSPRGKLFYGVVVELPRVEGVSHIWQCKLADEAGRSVSNCEHYIDRWRYGEDMKRALGNAYDPTLLEDVVGAASPGKATSMRRDRINKADRDAQARVRSEVRLLAFPEMDPEPKSFALEVSATVPEPGGDVIVAEFDRVLVP